MQVRLIAAAVLLLIGFASAWYIQDSRWTSKLDKEAKVHSDTLAEIARVAAGQIQREQEKRADLERRLSDVDATHYKEFQDVQDKNQRLAADLATARQRLSVRTVNSVCAGGLSGAANASSVDDGGQRAELHPEDAAAVVAITGDADNCAVKLTGLQNWVRAGQGRGEKGQGLK